MLLNKIIPLKVISPCHRRKEPGVAHKLERKNEIPRAANRGVLVTMYVLAVHGVAYWFLSSGGVTWSKPTEGVLYRRGRRVRMKKFRMK
jgi:hypothetical protein